MGKIKELIKKYDTFVMIVIIGIIALTFTFVLKLNANDTLWNFSNVYKMSNGYEIYKDLNVIITPLFFYIGKIIFSIFPRNYLTYSIYQNTIIYTMLFSMCYILMKKIGLKKINAMLFTSIISILTIAIMSEGSYNILAIFFVILGVYNIIANIGSNKNKHIVNIAQGIICFLVFATKQNIGVLFIISMSIAQLLTIKNKKEFILNMAEQGITVILLLTSLFGYMHIKGNLEGFINYAFLGISEFSKENLKFAMDSTAFVIAGVVFSAICMIMTYIKKMPFADNEKRTIRILAVISIFMNIIAYPILNIAHALIGNVVFMILVSYMIEILIFREFISGKKVELIKKISLSLIIITISVICLINSMALIVKLNSDNYDFPKDSIYYGAIVEKEMAEEIKDICKYIQDENNKGYDVKVISCNANLYMNLLNKNNGVMDLPFYGNLGKDGVEGLKNQINNLRNTKILVVKDEENIHMQESKELIEYIKNNFEENGEIHRFLIYNSK